MARSKQTQPGRCVCCGRTLTDERSIARGVGPECATDERCRRATVERIAPQRYVARSGIDYMFHIIDTQTGETVERCGNEGFARRRAAERNVDAHLAAGVA